MTFTVSPPLATARLTSTLPGLTSSPGFLNTMMSPGLDVAVGQEPRQRRKARRVGELVDEQVVADEDRALHRAGRHLVGLHDEGPHEEDEDPRHQERLVPLARRRVPRAPRRRPAVLGLVFHSTFSTARNASCGMSTRPTRFMRFLPSFCFSRSFRFRVMSPP